MARTRLTRDDVDDIIQGATLLGAGGGGSPDNAAQIADDAFESVDSVTLVSPDELGADDDVIVTGGMGSPESSKGPEAPEEVYAVEAYTDTIGPISHVVPFEIGAGNVTRPIRAGAELDVPVVDGDGAGRAVPELQLATFHLEGVDIAPFAVADWNQNSAVLFPNDTKTGENMSRALTVEFGSSAGFACYPMSGPEARDVLIGNTISHARDVGQTMNDARAAGRDVPTAVTDEFEGDVLVRGEITEVTSETRDGFDVGRVLIESDSGEVTVDVKNENILVWRDDRPIAMAPDLICWIDSEGNALTNADLEAGMTIACIALPAPEEWRTPDALALFQPVLDIFGYEGEYQPFTEL